MRLLCLGLFLFVGVHLLPSAVPLRRTLVARLGELAYKGLFALTALAGIVLMVMGMRGAETVVVYTPPAWGRTALQVLMPIAFILFFASNMPTNIKRCTRHPQLWGLTLWAVAHLLVNGDRAGLLLFSVLIAFSLADMASANLRGAVKSDVRQPVLRDVLAVAVGLAAYGLTLLVHPSGPLLEWFS